MMRVAALSSAAGIGAPKGRPKLSIYKLVQRRPFPTRLAASSTDSVVLSACVSALQQRGKTQVPFISIEKPKKGVFSNIPPGRFSSTKLSVNGAERGKPEDLGS
jgi:hypothetical protein